MSLVTLVLRNARRNRTRAALTVAAIAITLVAFALLRTVAASYHAYADQAAVDRLVVRHRVAGNLEFPIRYADITGEVPGVSALFYSMILAATDPRYPAQKLYALGGPSEKLADIFTEVELPDEQRRRWLANRHGAIVGHHLAERHRIAVGDSLILSTPEGALPVKVEGIYRLTRVGFPWFTVLVHYDYLNSIRAPERRNQIKRIDARVTEPERADAVVRLVSERLEQESEPTLTESEATHTQSHFFKQGTALAAVEIGSIAILAIMLLLLGNAIAMSVREQTPEYALMRALGFRRRHVLLCVIAECGLLGVAGAAVGVASAGLIVNVWIGGWIRQNALNLVAHWQADPQILASSAAVTVAVAVVAASVPAWLASRARVRDALRHVG